MRRDSLKISVKVEDFITALENKREREDKTYKNYCIRYRNESIKSFKKTADKLRKIADKIERGYIPPEVSREDYNKKTSLKIAVNLMKIPSMPDAESINSLIKALQISSSKTISLDRWEYESYFSE